MAGPARKYVIPHLINFPELETEAFLTIEDYLRQLDAAIGTGGGGGGPSHPEEVFIGAADPGVGSTYDLWYDTDAPSVTQARQMYVTVADLTARDALNSSLGTGDEGLLCYVRSNDWLFSWTGSAWAYAMAPLWGAWVAYAPTTTGITLGTGGTTVGFWRRTGRKVEFQCITQLGTAGIAVATGPTWSMPFTAAATEGAHVIGQSTGFDANGALQSLDTVLLTNAVVEPRYLLVSGSAASTLAQITATLPITWAINDRFVIRGTYLAATD